MSVDYQLIKSRKRKTLGLQVKAGKVFVRAPHTLAQATIDAFILDKEAWLRAKVDQQINYLANTDTLTYLPESSCLYQGEKKQIQVVFVRKPYIEITMDTLIVGLSKRYQINTYQSDALHGDSEYLKPLIKKHIEQHLQEQAMSDLTERLHHWQLIIGHQANELKIKRFKARWGSCTSQGVVSLNYLLMMCPVFVRDYVVIHELCHLVHLNHSPAFWHMVSLYCPQYKLAKKWFHDNQILLTI